MIGASRRLSRVQRVFDAYQDRSAFVRLDRNEDPVGWDGGHFREFMSGITPHDLAAYSDSSSLVRNLSSWLGVPEDWIYVTAGSDAAIKNIFETYVDADDRVLLQNPSWRMYDVYADAYRAQPVFEHYAFDLGFDAVAFGRKLQEGSFKVAILANPNQPTGTLVGPQALADIASAAKGRDTVFVVDEAYHLFTEETALALVADHANMIVVRTFSKAFGLAGLRIGYCVARPERIRELMLLRPVTDANSLALKCAEYVLDHMDWMRARIDDFIRGREYLYGEMLDCEVATFRSHTNFILIRCASDAEARTALSEMRALGYLLKGPFGFSPLENCIRVSVGPESLMRDFWRDCGAILRRCSAPSFLVCK